MSRPSDFEDGATGIEPRVCTFRGESVSSKLVENCILVGNPDLGAATGGVENCVFEVVMDLGAAIG